MNNKSKIAYLTIDDAPSVDFKNKVDYLISKKIPAIFFCEGQKLKKYEEDLIYAIQNNFLIANHSWSHANFNDLSKKEIKEEVISTDKVIEDIYYKAEVERKLKLFRFPFLNKGEDNKEFAQSLLRNLGYEQGNFEGIDYKWYREEGHDKDIDVSCTYDSMDWTVANGSFIYGIKTLQDLLDRMDEDVPEGHRGLNYKGSSDIILVHDDPRIKDFFQPMIEHLLEKGVSFK
ncbi:polysaccharide deacetylase family protein [Natronospora cellulosivora (SeqCode)]